MLAAGWMSRTFQALAPRAAVGELDAALEWSFPDPALRPYRADFAVVDPELLSVVGGAPLPPEFASAVTE